MKKIRIKEEYCIGCRLCEIHCLVQHSRVHLPSKRWEARRIIKAYRGKHPLPLPRIRVEEQGYVSFALQCRHCEDAPCLDACMSAAMQRDEKTGLVICNEDKCVGCWMCIMVCPYGVIRRGEEEKIASKCDFCYGEEIPVCVKNCPNEALIFEEKGEK